VISYQSVQAPVRPAFAASHQRFWDRLAAPGTWWSGPERVAIAREARAARQCPLCRERRAALSPHAVRGNHATVTDLAPPAVEAIHAITNDAARLTRAWYERCLAAGLSDGAYVEIVGTVAALVSVDQFCRGLGLEEHPLPAPRSGAPSRYRPSTACADEAWVPMVPIDNAGTPEADLWPSGRTGNVIRALSLVPDEVRTLSDLSAAHYLPNTQVRDPHASQGALTRPQMELIAATVSVANGCFY
jgi:hypothetical protein